jgi:hypothetical protein
MNVSTNRMSLRGGGNERRPVPTERLNWSTDGKYCGEGRKSYDFRYERYS